MDSPLYSPPPISNVYTARITDHKYDRIAAQLGSMGSTALANATYGTDFVRSVDPKTKTYFYVDTTTGNEFSTIMFGEIMSSLSGTELSAKGSFYVPPGKDVKITDRTSVRDKLVIGPPKLLDQCPRLAELYHNQLAVLDEIVDMDNEYAATLGRGAEPFLQREWVLENGMHIQMKLPPKYGVPEAKESTPVDADVSPKKAGPGSGRRERNKRKREDDPPLKPAPAASSKAKVGNISSRKSGTNKENLLPNTDTQPLQIGSFVDPHVLPDFAGPLFALNDAKLVVNDLRHADNTLIHPADVYSALRPGTVVILTVSLIAWAMPGSSPRLNGMKNRYYTINVKSLKVVATSDEPVEERKPPAYPTSSSRPPPIPTSSKASVSLDAFESPDSALSADAEPARKKPRTRAQADSRHGTH